MGKMLTLVAGGAALVAACGGPEPRSIAMSNPTVTYTYAGDIRGEQLEEATTKAEDYCSDFDRSATLRGVEAQDGQNVATFECL